MHICLAEINLKKKIVDCKFYVALSAKFVTFSSKLYSPWYEKTCSAVINIVIYVPESIILYLLPEIPYFLLTKGKFSQRIKHYPEQSKVYHFIFSDMCFKKY